eukprot:361176-Chlamydomonas_euryale.AAC.6
MKAAVIRVARCMGRTKPHGTHGGEWGCMELMGYMALNGAAWAKWSSISCNGLHGAAWSCKELHGAAWNCMQVQ